ncbi:MAG: hypothetical protein RI907_3031 [Pseudomonadota bacterium]|jgi:AcrR family transcriptional regulator
MPIQPDTFADLPPRDRILHAAHDLFYGEGIRATGIDKVIAQAHVTKVTFYRQFASKDALVLAYLAYRHELWMGWLRTALAAQQAQGHTPQQALAAAMGAWFKREDFRGCAFLNATAELGATSPEVMALVREHKRDMAHELAQLLPAGAGRAARGRALAMVVDGAILQAQMGMPLAGVLEVLRTVVRPVFSV